MKDNQMEQPTKPLTLQELETQRLMSALLAEAIFCFRKGQLLIQQTKELSEKTGMKIPGLGDLQEKLATVQKQNLKKVPAGKAPLLKDVM